MNYGSRKFILAVFAIVVSAVSLYADKIGSGEWIASITIVLGLYGAANVAQRKVEK